MNGWINAKDKLPEPWENVLVNVASGSLIGIGIMFYCSDKKWHNGMYAYEGDITHWMPLPKPPVGEM